MFITVTILILFLSAAITYSLCKTSGKSDKLAEDIYLKDSNGQAECNNQCSNCDITESCWVYKVNNNK